MVDCSMSCKAQKWKRFFVLKILTVGANDLYAGLPAVVSGAASTQGAVLRQGTWWRSRRPNPDTQKPSQII